METQDTGKETQEELGERRGVGREGKWEGDLGLELRVGAERKFPFMHEVDHSDVLSERSCLRGRMALDASGVTGYVARSPSGA